MILHALLQWLRPNINQSLNPQNTSHTSAWRASYGIYIAGIWLKENWPHYNGIALYYFPVAKHFARSLPSSVRCHCICRRSDDQIPDKNLWWAITMSCTSQDVLGRVFLWFGSCQSNTSQRRHNERDGISNRQPRDPFTQPFIRAPIRENIKAPRHWPSCG